MSTFLQRYRSYCNSRRAHAGFGGFTLVELLVVVALVIIISAVVLVRHTSFNSTTLLRSLSYSVALSMRQAQVYGTSVRGTTGASPVYAPGYGVYFSTALGCANGTGTCYILFADADGDNTYDTGEAVATQTLSRGFAISNFCAVTATPSATHCVSGGSTAISSLTVYFRRPNPEALFYTSGGSGYAYAYIELTSAVSAGTLRTVKVTSTGQIAVCPLNMAPASC